MPDLFGTAGRELLGRLSLPEPWASEVAGALSRIDTLDDRITGIEVELRRQGAEHPGVPLLVTAPGLGWGLAHTVSAELGEIDRFSSPKKLVGYSRLSPKVCQSGGKDLRGSLTKNAPKCLRWALTKNAPKCLRWALIEAATHAGRHPAYRDHYQRTATRLGRQRGKKVARVEVARKLAEAIWHMLDKGEPFAPCIPTPEPLAA